MHQQQQDCSLEAALLVLLPAAPAAAIGTAPAAMVV